MGIVEFVCVLAGALVLALALTWPLAQRLDRAQRIDSGDGQYALWNVAWVAHALTTGDRVYDTNIFHPHDNTLAYSEGNLGGGVMATPAYWLTGNAVLAYNTVFLIGGFVFAAAAAYALAHYVTGSRAGAAFAAVGFAFCPFIFARLPHIQLQLSFGIPLSLLALHRLVDAVDEAGTGVRIRRSVALGVALFVQALCCAYYGIFAGLAIGLSVLFFAWSRGLWRRGSWWLCVAIAAATSVLLVLPFFLPYLAVQKAGFGRPLEEARFYAANVQSWFVSSSYAHRWMQPWLTPWKDVLFPGFLPLLFAAAGIWRGFQQSNVPGLQGCRVREATALYALIGLFALWISFGPDGGLYTVLFHTIPVFTFLRAPARVGIVAQLAIVVLGAVGIARITAGWRPRTTALAAGAAVALLAAEFTLAPIRYLDVPPLERAWQALRTLPRGPVAAFPFYSAPEDFHRHTYYMMRSMDGWPRILNGYSDHIPDDYAALGRASEGFPNYAAFQQLRQRRVRYVIFHTELYARRHLALVKEGLDRYRDYLTPVVIADDSWLYEITKWPE
jgi:hypothetical protein